ncbi:site-specific integrase [Xenorhabdus bovienii]|uniref:Site-specific integrase n=1 Tax=Xenorhabdus bovienii TaxID=40576 RepID=A0AAJ1J9E2_XENBV|nr:site-specific integrase [Xenorhabdus bovienii]MDE1479414.1 site-specific integrase [Xenorhabdus bovienii]MDE9511065.1 site-specific integrase [Xenorhabdus bovienii]MDE9519029.1 site-specific integrase [Xenorhabdus bovienii]MDE9522722.1 site-specific integrase [Xenorhabdus bovienii]
MPIYKRSNKYWIDVSAPNGERIRRSTGTEDKLKAQEYHDKVKHELWQLERLDKQPERYFEEMIIMALRDAEPQSCFANKQIYARYFLSIFKGRKISSITSEEITNSLPTHSNETKSKLSNATQNRYRAFIMRSFSLAYKMGWITKPHHVTRLREAKVRVRWLERHQAVELINNLSLDWMKKLVSFALLTGARKGEIFSLTWRNVDIDRRIAVITAENAKSGKARAVPLNDEVVSILRNLPRDCEFVFSSNAKRIKQISRTDFDRALKKSEIDDFRFHDLRHTWASWHAQSGTPLMALKEMGGWETLEMVNKYAHLSGEHLAKYSGVVTFLTQTDKCSSQKQHLKLLTG